MCAVDARAARELTGLKYKGYTKNWSGWKKNKAVDHDYKPVFKHLNYGLKKNKDLDHDYKPFFKYGKYGLKKNKDLDHDYKPVFKNYFGKKYYGKK
jgi:hypothetical protein